MRYLIKYTKESEIKFISHLDVLRTIQRIIRRARLPIEYSKGFNPHMNISIAQPLSVGMYSSGEYMDVVLTEKLNEKYIKEELNQNSPAGIHILDVTMVPVKENEKKFPQSMALIDAAKYEIHIKYSDTNALEKELISLLQNNEWKIVKKSKSGEKLVNIKPMIKEFKFEVLKGLLKVSTVVACGSRENLSAELLSDFIKMNTSAVLKDSFTEIERKEMYAYKDKKLVSLHEIAVER